tara:strand:- start:2088 stop:2372 length:285 start_codon:yes stop_codon:yes gene_type:complete
MLATAVAESDNYNKVIDETKVDFSESRAKELNGLLETKLKDITIDEAEDANICAAKWIDEAKLVGPLRFRLEVQGFAQVWLKAYHDTSSDVLLQ